VTGLLPGYANLGIVAPVLLVLLRIVQGIGVGRVWRRHLVACRIWCQAEVPRLLDITRQPWYLPRLDLCQCRLSGVEEQFRDHRVADCHAALRHHRYSGARGSLQAADSPLFEQLKRREQLARMPSLGALTNHAVPILLLATVSAFQLMYSVVSGTYAISFMRFAGIPLATTATIIFISRIGDVLGVLLSGPLADLCKRRMLAYLAIGLTTLWSYPSTLAILHRHIPLAIVLQFLITFFGIGLLHGLAPILTSESFPTKFRYSGTGISFSLAGVLGGMLAPPLLARLIGQDVLHKWYYLPMIYAVYCAAAMLALLFIPETRDSRLEDLDQGQPHTAAIPIRPGAELYRAADRTTRTERDVH